MKLVVDTNVVVSAMVRDSVTRRLLFHPALELFSPPHLFEELEEHKAEIMQKSGFTEIEFSDFISALAKIVFMVSEEAYKKHMRDVAEVIADPNDLQFAASAIVVNSLSPCGIWSNDPHFTTREEEFFNRFGIKIWTTYKVYQLLKKP